MSKNPNTDINDLQECITEISAYLGWAQDENEYLRARIKKLEAIMRIYGLKIPDEELDLPIC
jgi:hypothetical protein